MEISHAVADVLCGASLQQVAADYRARLVADLGLRTEEVAGDRFRDEVATFMRGFARHLGDRHAGNPRVGQALREWVRLSDHYEAWDALLSGFAVDGREALVRRGRMLFPGPLTAHWAES